MIEISKSLIRFRNAAGAMLAVSAIFAVVMSTVSMPGDRAFGQTMTDSNATRIQNALDAFEAAAADPDFDASTTATPPDATDGKITQLRAAVTTLEAALSIDPTVSVDWLSNSGTDTFNQLVPPQTATPTLSVALTAFTTGSSAGTPLRILLAGLGSGRGDIATALEAADAVFTALKALDNVATPPLGLTDATKSELDRLNNSLLTTTPDPVAFKTLVEDTLKADENWYPDGFTEGTDALPSDATAQLNALYSRAISTGPDAASEHPLGFLQFGRNIEARALPAIKKLLKAVKTVIDDYEFTALPGDASAADRAARAVEEAALKTAQDAVAPLIAFLTADDQEFYALDDFYVFEAELAMVLGSIPPNGLLRKSLDAIETVLIRNKVEDFDFTDEDDPQGSGNPDGVPDDLTDDDAALWKLENYVLVHIIAALRELDDLDGTDAQRAAIADLDELLTKVDDLFVAGDADDDSIPVLEMSDLDRLQAALDAFDALIVTLEPKHVDTSAIVAVRRAANEVPFFLASNIATPAAVITTALSDATTGPALLAALKTGILADALAEDSTITTVELTTALKMTYDDQGTDSTGDDTVGIDDIYATVRAWIDLATEYEAAAGSPLPGVSTTVTLFRNAINLRLDNTVFFAYIPAKHAAAAYRSSPSTTITNDDDLTASTLPFNDFAAMAALQAALGALDGDDLDAQVKAARDALIATNGNKDGLTDDAQSEVSTSHREIIATGAGHHAHALNAAFMVVDAAISTSGVDPDLAANIRAALATQAPYEQQAQAKISRIESSIRGVTVSAGDEVKLEVMIYGRQDLPDQKLADAVTFDWGDASDDNGSSITYTAPSSPGTYTVRAYLDPNECFHAEPEVRMEKCSATFEVTVRRKSVDPAPSDPPQDPPGEIPAILTDGDGNQYEVFTPEGGGTFTGEGHSLVAGAGAVPNGEYIGIRMSDEGPASNVGMTHQRYTLGGDMYEVSAVDASGASITSYVLNAPATACLPLPAELSANISDLAIVAKNEDGSLTILSASVRLGSGSTSVCGSLSGIPATLAVGSEGAPAAIPTATPEPEPETPDTGGTAPTSSTMALWALLLGTAALTVGGVLAIGRRRWRIN